MSPSEVISGLYGGVGLQNGERSIPEIMPSHVSITILSPPPRYPTGQQSQNPEIFWPIPISMAVDIQFDIGETRSVDISQESDCAEILQNLETAGWFIVKNATSVDSNTHQSQLENNAAVRQILGLEKNLYKVGRFRKREVNMHTRGSFFQSNDGKLLQPSLRIIFVIHLGTTRDEIWFFEYKPINSQIPVELTVNGTDIIFVASWMIWRLPWRAEVTPSHMAEIVYVKSSP